MTFILFGHDACWRGVYWLPVAVIGVLSYCEECGHLPRSQDTLESDHLVPPPPRGCRASTHILSWETSKLDSEKGKGSPCTSLIHAQPSGCVVL